MRPGHGSFDTVNRAVLEKLAEKLHQAGGRDKENSGNALLPSIDIWCNSTNVGAFVLLLHAWCDFTKHRGSYRGSSCSVQLFANAGRQLRQAMLSKAGGGGQRKKHA